MKPLSTIALLLLIVGSTAYTRPTPEAKLSISKESTFVSAEVFGNFHVHRQGDFASLNWSVVSGNVHSFNIERSYDGEFFELIAIVTPESTRWNRYVDKTVEPGVIYYRIIAVMNSGADEWSTTESVKIVRHK